MTEAFNPMDPVEIAKVLNSTALDLSDDALAIALVKGQTLLEMTIRSISVPNVPVRLPETTKAFENMLQTLLLCENLTVQEFLGALGIFLNGLTDLMASAQGKYTLASVLGAGAQSVQSAAIMDLFADAVKKTSDEFDPTTNTKPN